MGTSSAGSVTNCMTEESPPSLFHFFFYPDRFSSCMVYTYGIKEGRERDKLDDTEESPTSPSVLSRFDFHAWCTPTGTRMAGSVTNSMTEESPTSPLFYFLFLFFIPIRFRPAWCTPTGTGRAVSVMNRMAQILYWTVFTSVSSSLPLFSCMVYTYGNKAGRTQAELGGFRLHFLIHSAGSSMPGVHSSEQDWPCAFRVE